VDESSVSERSPSELCMALSRLKATDVASRHPECCVIGADTIVCIDDTVLGKPADSADAFRMLSMLSGRSHHVLTGICVCYNGTIISNTYCDTEVFFKPLLPSEIERYITSGDPFDKAGAYGIQNGAACFCEKIDGDFFNVVGLPVNLLYEILAGSGLINQ
jgi:septum formation protein